MLLPLASAAPAINRRPKPLVPLPVNVEFCRSSRLKCVTEAPAVTPVLVLLVRVTVEPKVSLDCLIRERPLPVLLSSVLSAIVPRLSFNVVPLLTVEPVIVNDEPNDKSAYSIEDPAVIVRVEFRTLTEPCWVPPLTFSVPPSVTM